MYARIVSLLAVFVLCGCASTTVPWINPALPEDQWGKDWRACKRWAESQIGYQEPDESSPFRDYDRGVAKRRVDSYAGSCMTERGYMPARPKR